MTPKPTLGDIVLLHVSEREGGSCRYCGKNPTWDAMEACPGPSGPFQILIATGPSNRATILAYKDAGRTDQPEDELGPIGAFPDLYMELSALDWEPYDLFNDVPDDHGLYVWQGTIIYYEDEVEYRGTWRPATMKDLDLFREQAHLPAV